MGMAFQVPKAQWELGPISLNALGKNKTFSFLLFFEVCLLCLKTCLTLKGLLPAQSVEMSAFLE